MHGQADVEDLAVIVDISVVSVWPVFASEGVPDDAVVPDGGVVGGEAAAEGEGPGVSTAGGAGVVQEGVGGGVLENRADDTAFVEVRCEGASFGDSWHGGLCHEGTVLNIGHVLKGLFKGVSDRCSHDIGGHRSLLDRGVLDRLLGWSLLDRLLEWDVLDRLLRNHLGLLYWLVLQGLVLHLLALELRLGHVLNWLHLLRLRLELRLRNVLDWLLHILHGWLWLVDNLLLLLLIFSD